MIREQVLPDYSPPPAMPGPAHLGARAQEETVSSLMPQHHERNSPSLGVQPCRSWSGETGTGGKVRKTVYANIQGTGRLVA